MTVKSKNSTKFKKGPSFRKISFCSGRFLASDLDSDPEPDPDSYSFQKAGSGPLKIYTDPKP